MFESQQELEKQLLDVIMKSIDYNHLAKTRTSDVLYNPLFINDSSQEEYVNKWGFERLYEDLELNNALQSAFLIAYRNHWKEYLYDFSENNDKEIIMRLDYFEKYYNAQNIYKLLKPYVEKRLIEIKRSFLDEKEKIVNNVLKHHKTLLKKRLQKIMIDDYGEKDTKKWDKELRYFISNIVKISDTYESYFLTLINELLDKYKEPLTLDFDDRMSGYEYEVFCTNVLLKQNIDAKTTKASGDQGVDILANINNKSIAIQCKLQSTPVSNSAVQEVFAAKTHFNTDVAIVVSNNTFTDSAKELANTTKVLLLHHDDLLNIRYIVE